MPDIDGGSSGRKSPAAGGADDIERNLFVLPREHSFKCTAELHRYPGTAAGQAGQYLNPGNWR